MNGQIRSTEINKSLGQYRCQYFAVNRTGWNYP